MFKLFIELLILGVSLIYLANHLFNKEKTIKRKYIKTEATITNIEYDTVGTIYTVQFIKDGKKEKHKTIHYYRKGKELSKGENINIEYYIDKKYIKIFILDDDMVPYNQDGASGLQIFFLFSGIISCGLAAYIALSYYDDFAATVPFLKNLDPNVLIAVIFIFGIIMMIISGLKLVKDLKIKGKVVTTQIIKKEYHETTNRNDHHVDRYLFTIKDNGKEIMDEFEINDYTSSIKKGDMVEVRIYKKHFQFEKEWQEMMNKK